MDPALQELLAEGLPDDEVGVVLRLVDPRQVPDGIRIVAQFGHIATCRLRRADIPQVRAEPQVASMKRAHRYSRPWPESDPDIVDAASEADVLVAETDQRRPDGDLPTGKGVAVAHIDWGVDFAHPDFRTPDGRSRLLALWDQSRPYDPAHPNRYGYGRIYDHEQISLALRTPDPYATLGYHPAASDGGHGSHGTHTLGISGGSGLGGGPSGVAPGAALIFVHLSTGATEDPALLSREAELVGDLGDSVGFLEALDFIQRIAGDRPVVINASVGRIAGEHDGFALTEQGMDAFLNAAPGRAIVNSAGNYFDRSAHACGVVRPGQNKQVRFSVPAGASLLTEIDFWYPGADRLELAVRPPGNETEVKAVPGQRVRIVVDGKEVGRLYHRIGDPNNGDNEITLFLDPTAPTGEWELQISGEVVVDGRFHAWIERTAAKAGQRSRFHEDDSDPTTTLGTICNGFRTIAVGAYNAHEAGRPLAPFSSCGPDRYGRPKPDLVAPGVRVLSARSHSRKADSEPPLQVRMSGTSMAAPCVAGAIALIFAAARRLLNIDETRRILLGTTDPISPEADYIAKMRLGSGYLNTAAAVALAREAQHWPVRAAPAETEGAVEAVTAEQLPIAEPTEQRAMKATSQVEGISETGEEQCAVCGRPSAESATDFSDVATEPEVAAEAVSRHDSLGRPFGGGGGLPFQFQIPITGGAPAIALPFGGSASPFAFTVPLGGSPAPQPPAPQPTTQPAPTPASTPSEPPPITVASTDAPVVIPGTEGALTDSEFWQTDALGAEAVELLNIQMAQGEQSEAGADSVATPIAQRPFGELVLEAAEGLDLSATDEPSSASVLEALARAATASLLGSSTADEGLKKVLFSGLPAPTASRLFNGLAGAEPAAQAPSRLVALARPNEIVREAELRPGDLFIRVARGEGWSRVAIVASPRLYERDDLAAAGLRGEGYPVLLPGQYVHVVEPCTARRLSTTRFARRLTDDNSRTLAGTLIVRIITPADEADSPEPQQDSKAPSNGGSGDGDRVGVLRKGDSGDAVRRLQQAINRVHADMVALGLPGLPGCPLPEDGTFSEPTERAVVALQQTIFNDPAKWNGVAGKETWRQLEVLTGSASQPAEMPPGAAGRARTDAPQNGRARTQRSERNSSSGARRAASTPAQFESYGEASPCDQAIDASQLSWPGASSDQMDLMRRVYQRQVASACRVRTFVGDVPDGELGTIEQQIKARQSAADSCRQLLAAARAAQSSDPSATNVGSVGVVSGYRSASHQLANWNRAFPQYYAETLAQRRALSGGEFGERAASLLANYITHRLAAPGFSLHNDGLAIDFVTVQGAATMGASTSASNRERWRRSWFFSWLGANAPSYGFFQNTSIDEPWHWEFRPTTQRASSAPAPDTTELEYVDQDTFTESTIITGRLELSNTPLLASHRGTQPDLILRWNTFNDTAAIDTVVHLHGYSSDRERMKLANKEAYSGLDFANPVDSSDSRPGRTRPTLGILPRGSYEGDRPKANPERYGFPALTSGTGFSDLISYSLGAFATAASLTASPPTGRSILTAHSGGGAALMRLLAQSNPDEIHCFDALYTDASPLITWLNARIATEIQAWTPDKLRADGGLCVIYRPGGTKAQSLRVDRAIRTAIAAAPTGAQGPLQNAYRVLRTSVAHGEIPRRFGWLLLSDVSQWLAGTSPADTEAFNDGMESAETADRSSQEYIRWIQTSLNSIDSAGLKVDGINGPKTQAAIREFQARNGLQTDGLVGPLTEARIRNLLVAPATQAPLILPPVVIGRQPDLSVRCVPPPTILDRFVRDRSALTSTHDSLIQGLAARIVASQATSTPVHLVCMVGHTDSTAAPQYNQELGQRRADTVRLALISAVEKASAGMSRFIVFEASSRGETSPVADNSTPDGAAQNRRVEVFLNNRWLDGQTATAQASFVQPVIAAEAIWDEQAVNRARMLVLTVGQTSMATGTGSPLPPGTPGFAWTSSNTSVATVVTRGGDTQVAPNLADITGAAVGLVNINLTYKSSTGATATDTFPVRVTHGAGAGPDSSVAATFVASNAARHCTPGQAGSATCGPMTNPRLITRIVIHTLALSSGTPSNMAATMIARWPNPPNPGDEPSAPHYVVDRAGIVTQVVREDEVAFHAIGANRDAIGIEHSDICNDPEPFTDAQYSGSAALIRDIGKRHQITLDRTTVVAHSQVDPARRSDPGAYWDFDFYLALAGWDGTTATTKPIRLIARANDLATSPAGWTSRNRRTLHQDICAMENDPFAATFRVASPSAKGDPLFLTVRITVAGNYSVACWWGKVTGANSASPIHVEVSCAATPCPDAAAFDTILDQHNSSAGWRTIGRVNITSPPATVTVTFRRNSTATGLIVADSIRLLKSS